MGIILEHYQKESFGYKGENVGYTEGGTVKVRINQEDNK